MLDKISDYFKSQKIVAEHLYFYVEGCKHQGRGFIKWNSKDGFTLDAFLDPLKKHLEKSSNLGEVRIPKKSDYSSIRIWTGYGWIFVPDIHISDHFKVGLMQGKLSLKFEYIFICTPCFPTPSNATKPKWYGSALYRIEDKNIFSDPVTVQTRLENQLIEQLGKTGFLHNSSNIELKGYFIEDKYFHLNWILSQKCYSKVEAWNWPIGFKGALQTLSGETVQMLQRQMRRGIRKVIEVRSEYEHESLGIFRLFDKHSLRGSKDDSKKLILHLSNFFCRERKHHVVCRSIFFQVLEASRQQLQSSQELFISTALEAIIRTVYEFPVTKLDNSQGLVESYLNGRFKGTYFLDDRNKEFKKEWTDFCRNSVEAFKRLRIRNAHPDWLTQTNNSEEDSDKEQALNDMIYLCRFYGHIILALSGIKLLRPSVPEPHQNWGAVATIYQKEKKIDEEFKTNDNWYRKMLKRREMYRSHFTNL
ncbi:MAG: hypothetical protein AAGG51_21145 [Cyanobacteria bacterium P01_G01_bin.54]